MISESHKAAFATTWGGLVIGGVIAAWFAAPLLRFANPAALAVSGLLLGFAAWTLYRGAVLGKRWQHLIAILTGGPGLILLSIVLLHSIRASFAVDSICLGLQGKMQIPAGDANAAAAFDALGCRPQFPAPGDLFA